MSIDTLSPDLQRLGTLEQHMGGNIVWFGADEYAEPGYALQSGPIVFGDWNGTYASRLANVLERAGYELEWCDEWATCSDCNKAVRTQPDSHGWLPSFYLYDDCEHICHECARNDLPAYIEHLSDDDTRADTFGIDFQALGFYQIPTDTYFENGWHPGQTDDPTKLGPALTPDEHERVWQITGTGQFDIRFILFVRPLD